MLRGYNKPGQTNGGRNELKKREMEMERPTLFD